MRVRIEGKIWDKAAVQELIDTNSTAVARALMIVYANQTRAEQAQGQTIEHNGIGFTGRDAEFLTDIAIKWQRWGRWASERQLRAVRRSVRKYHKQVLMEMAKRPGAEIIRGRLPKETPPAPEPEFVSDGQMALVGDW